MGGSYTVTGQVLNLTWGSVPNAAEYEVIALQDGDVIIDSIVGHNSTSVLINQTPYAQDVIFTVRATANGYYPSPVSSEATVTIPAGAVSPANVTLIAYNEPDIRIEVAHNSLNVSYKYYVKRVSTGVVTATATTISEAMNFQIYPIATDEVYQARVKTYIAGIERADTGWLPNFIPGGGPITVPATVINTPTMLSVDVDYLGDFNKVRVTWTKEVGVSMYDIHYDLNNGMGYWANPNVLFTTSGNVVTAFITLTSNQRDTAIYITVKVGSRYTGDPSVFSPPMYSVPFAIIIPAPVTGLDIAYNNPDLTLSWDASAGATSYNLRLYIDGVYTTPSSNTTSLVINAPHLAGKQVKFSVSAVGAGGSSAYPGYKIQIIDQGLISPLNVRETKTMGGATSRYKVDWDAVGVATEYRTRYKEGSGAWVERTVNVNRIDLLSLTIGVTITFEITSLTATNESWPASVITWVVT